ncbi:hypothetical protein QBC47DRAFT_400316 [Echria macrotheca]|uniref:CBM1 domain-containing protein n=1 Tax=Echria macrotheca TaxID=438768 RepID=A0AAJ0BH14_9PEZI|nr:hypothetical protein QBC47DRAFT_400316 [Echria macrotheca]
MVTSLFFLSLLAGTGMVAAQRGRPPPVTTVPSRTTSYPPGATQTLYGQCGGQTYNGPTSCPAGSYCQSSASNVWYSQCVPISNNNNPGQGQGQGGSSAEIRTLTTLITVDGPYPTVISTQITYLQPRPTRTTTSPVEVVTVTLVPDEPCDHDYYC